MPSRRWKPRRRRRGSSSSGTYLNWVDHIVDASKRATVVVMRKSDAVALQRLGVKNVFFMTKPYFKFIESIAKKKKQCVLLINATRPGNSVCERVKQDLQKQGVKVNTRFRKMLFNSASKEVAGFLKFMHKRVMGAERKHAAGPPHGLA